MQSMAIRKKTTTESETVKLEGTANAGQKSLRPRNTASAETAGTPDNRTAKAQSPAAATHKSPARKSANAAPVAEAPVETGTIQTTTFDLALHHDEISKEAYSNWLRNGCPQGSEHHDWLAAIEIVRTRHGK